MKLIVFFDRVETRYRLIVNGGIMNSIFMDCSGVRHLSMFYNRVWSNMRVVSFRKLYEGKLFVFIFWIKVDWQKKIN